MLSKEYFAKLEILDVYQEDLLDISDEDAKAEGYLSRDEYLVAFCRINKLGLGDLDNLMVWVVRFRCK
jgi:hypothetical protein